MSEHTPTPWYIGAMTDQLYIIDEPPRPAPKDYENTSLKTRAIAKTFEAPGGFAEEEANAARLTTCVNAFHDPAGRKIATEDIGKGLFWRLYDFALILKACPPDYAMGEVVSELLRSLKVQGPET